MPTVNRIAFTVFGIDVYWYGIIIAGGVLLAAIVATLREKRVGVPKDTTLNLSLWMIPCALIAARLYYVAFSWDQFAADPWLILNIHTGGMAIYGGIIGGALCAMVYAKASKIPFLKLCDLVAPSLALGQAIGRWGNFVNQEAYGVAVTNPALKWFPAAVWIEANQGWYCATFFYESAWCFLIVAALLIAERMGKFHRTGDIFLWYVLLYAFERALVEGLRTDSLYWGPVRVSQALSAAMFLICVGILVYRKIHHTKARLGRE